MRFEFVAYRVQESATIPGGIVYRPEVTVRLRGPRGELVISALVDTGADETVLPRSLAGLLGVEPDAEQGGFAQGVTGQLMSLAPAIIDIELLGSKESYRWTTLVSFADFPTSDDECVILGHAGALELFIAEFDGERRAGELRPNSSFRGSIDGQVTDER